MIDHPDNTGKSYRAIARLGGLQENAPPMKMKEFTIFLVCFALLQVFLSAFVGKVPGVRVQMVGHTVIILAMRLFYPG